VRQRLIARLTVLVRRKLGIALTYNLLLLVSQFKVAAPLTNESEL